MLESSEGSISLNANTRTEMGDLKRSARMHVRVERGEATLVQELQPGGGARVVLLCAEDGMGKSTLLSRCVLTHMQRDIESKLIDLSTATTTEACETMRKVLRWCRRKGVTPDSADVKSCVAFDNVPIGDEADVASVVALVRRMVECNCFVVLSCKPTGEMIAEQMGEAACFWSCDLRTARPQSHAKAGLYDEYTQGIPLLSNALSRIESCSMERVPTDPIYQEPYVRAIEATIYEDMMGEEQRLRCAMLLLGCGTKDDLVEVLDTLDSVLWRTVSRDSPFFGVNTSKETFCCVGAHSKDCLNISFAVLNTLARPWPSLVAKCAQKLASQGNVERAAVVALMCKEDKQRCSVVMRWGARMIDVGEVDVVADALETTRSRGFTSLEGLNETRMAFDTLMGNKGQEYSVSSDSDNSLGARHAWLIATCRAMMRGDSLSTEVLSCHQDDMLATALVAHARTLGLLAKGLLADAYDLLLNSAVRLDGPTVSSSLVELDYLLCSFLMGIVPAKVDMTVMATAASFFGQTGLRQLSRLHNVILSAGMLVGGRASEEFSFESALQRASRRGDDFFHAVLLMAAGVADMRSGILPRAHVRFEQAGAFFQGKQISELLKIDKMLDAVVRAQMGERISHPELNACKGVTPTMDGVVAMLEAALSSEKLVRFSASSGWGSASHVHHVHWMVNILANDAGVVSNRFRSVMPTAWLRELETSAAAIDRCLKGEDFLRSGQKRSPDREGAHLMSSTRRLMEEAQIEVHMMGGFEVYAEGKIIPSNRLDRRRSKALLALLAAVPGHVVKRYMIMETVWPNYDYQSANKCVYTATSVLRFEMSKALRDAPHTPLVISNKSQGTVALNTAAVGCDVDVFERKARELLDMLGTDRETVVLCREIEELYKGDMFVPPTDGMGVIETRSRELRELFSDAMVAGARAALREGMKMLACRFARKAHDADELREDAITILVAALIAAGRQVDAERCFERYVGHVVDLTRKPPSHHLRAAVEELLRGSASGTEKGQQDAWTNAPRDGEVSPEDQLKLPLEQQDDEERGGEGEAGDADAPSDG